MSAGRIGGNLKTTKKKTEPKLSHPGVAAGSGNPELREGSAGMGPEEYEYRLMLQEAVIWVTRQVLDEMREEITKRAKDRVKTLRELRGT